MRPSCLINDYLQLGNHIFDCWVKLAQPSEKWCATFLFPVTWEGY